MSNTYYESYFLVIYIRRSNNSAMCSSIESGISRSSINSKERYRTVYTVYSRLHVCLYSKQNWIGCTFYSIIVKRKLPEVPMDITGNIKSIITLLLNVFSPIKFISSSLNGYLYCIWYSGWFRNVLERSRSEWNVYLEKYSQVYVVSQHSL